MTTTCFKTLHIDIETYSEEDLSKVGAYKYAHSDSFEITLFAYAFDDEPVRVIDLLQGESIPEEVANAIFDETVVKWAHNANFELICLGVHFGVDLDVRQWRCTMISGAYLGLPLGLDKIGEVLNLTNKKDKKGTALIKYFAMPCRPTKVNGGRTRNLPEHDPEKWAEFIEYARQDVNVERDIHAYADKVGQLPAKEWDYWHQDQEVGRRGIFVDVPFIEGAIKENADFMADTHAEIIKLTGVSNPNSPAQLKDWLAEQIGEPVTGLAKNDVLDLLADPRTPLRAKKVLELRQQGSNSSVAKYDTMQQFTNRDGRIRGLIQFYGANRTGRFAGRAVQIQNLKRTFDKGLELAKEAVTKGLAGVLYDDVSELISKLVRTALIGSPNNVLISCDFSAIEARVLAWLAGEDWVLEVFNTHGKLYEATASKMFDIPMQDIGKGSPWRSKGKVASLALGYQGAVGALIQMGAIRSGLTEEELPAIVKAWRASNPNIVRLWRNVEAYAKRCVMDRRPYTLKTKYTQIKFEYVKGYLAVTLPSGRKLYYYGAEVRDNKLTFWGMEQTRKMWTRLDTYGGSLVENLTQAIARDCLVETLDVLHYKGVNTIFHVHDEVVADEREDKAPQVLELMQNVMKVSPAWAPELPLSGEGYISKFYKKD